MAPPPRIRLTEFRLESIPCRTRLPFRFGIHTLTEAPLGLARGRVLFEDGTEAWGQASDLWVPKWFEKDPEKSLADDTAALEQSALLAAESARSEEWETAFDLWLRIHGNRVASVPRDGSDLLVRGYGVAMVERLVLDAVSRHAGLPFHAALSSGLFGLEPERIHGELSAWRPTDSLPDQPATSITMRHTVGLLDTLREHDLKQEVGDGLPETLEADIKRNGLDHFKIKVAGPGDLDRLMAVADVLREKVPSGARFTLDGNEQFEDMGQVADLLERVRCAPGGEEFLGGLLFIEQPLARARTFDPAAHGDMAAVTAVAPVLIDEADLDTWSFPAAIDLGYRGVSVKACKGVFRAVLNAGLCHVRGGGLFQSGEDLTNLPVIALQQDLALMTALGIEHVERNGHHYFRGLDHLAPEVVQYALDQHGDLYREDERGATLRIADGRLSIASLERPGLGADLLP
jgi:L-alanine-DL-glutamate epimerase-like enolase superfamily enzyme